MMKKMKLPKTSFPENSANRSGPSSRQGRLLRASQCVPWAFASPGRTTSDDRAEGNRHAVTCGLESTSDRPTGGDRVCECRLPSFSRMLESDGLDPTTEKCVALFQPIECGVQLR